MVLAWAMVVVEREENSKVKQGRLLTSQALK